MKQIYKSASLWKVKVSPSVVSSSLQFHGLYGPWTSLGQKKWVAFPFPFPRGSSQPRDWTQVSCIAGRFFTAEPQRKPKNTGVGSLSLLQGIFQTQKSNQGLLHCRRILYQLSRKFLIFSKIVKYHIFQNCTMKL